MTQGCTERLQFAIYELIDILAEDITGRVVTAVSKQLAAHPAGPPARDTSVQHTEPQPRRLLRRAEVTERTGLQKNTNYYQIRRGTFPAETKIGSSVRWLESDVEAWIDKHIPPGIMRVSNRYEKTGQGRFRRKSLNLWWAVQGSNL